MNGVDGVAVATGQDFRAIEASVHSFAARSGRYKGLSSFAIRDGSLVGEIEMPVQCGVKGGAIASNPQYSHALSLLNNPSASRLSAILVAVGLLQNFAALRAIVTQGISTGHMRLHARNIAIAAGADSHVSECVEWFLSFNPGCVLSSALVLLMPVLTWMLIRCMQG